MSNPFVEIMREYLDSPEGRTVFMRVIDREYQQMITKTEGDTSKV